MDPYRDPFAPPDTGYGMPGDPMEQVLSLQTYGTDATPAPTGNTSYGCVYGPGSGTYMCRTWYCETYGCVTYSCETFMCRFASADEPGPADPGTETW
ncbi:MAG TPA: hypothetical protein VNP72_04955 [Longimicrobium sp.]|nr:hypothetical protein [Longimicrobium sp.]